MNIEEQHAIDDFFDAYQRLKALGWREIPYAPKREDIWFEVIEPGSTGIHQCKYQERPTRGSFWVWDAYDRYPSHPVLWRPVTFREGDP